MPACVSSASLGRGRGPGILQQQLINEVHAGLSKLAEMYLDDEEYSLFEQFEGHAIRKNRYFHEFHPRYSAFDVYLGDLWGLNAACVDFQNDAEMNSFEPPPFAIFEVTSNPFFLGRNLVRKKFDDIRGEVAELGVDTPLPSEMPEE